VHTPNNLLSLLTPEELELIALDLKVVTISQGQVLAEPHEYIEHAYFPHSGIVSFVVEMSDGQLIESGMMGRDGVVGAIQALAGNVSPNKILIQATGQASIIPLDKLKAILARYEGVRLLLAKHEQFLLAQVQQSVGCNATHTVERRVCRWLSRITDLVGDEFDLTQEFMSQMIGVRRTSVSLVAHQLQEAGLIKYRRGHIKVVNVGKLKAASCECYEVVNGHYEKIFGKQVPIFTDDLNGYSQAAHAQHEPNDSRRDGPAGD
jgi:CRP-like cAMP-binding protein